MEGKTRMTLSGKSVLVTGGASGIGRAAATLLCEAGCHVIIADLNAQAGEMTAESLSKSGPGTAAFVRTDVSAEADVERMVQFTIDRHGPLDGAINAAGIAQAGLLLHEMSHEAWDHCLNVNLRGAFFCLKHEVRAMLPHGGAIVAVASTLATKGLRRASEYCASKAGVTGLVRAAALEYADRGIRINSISPGATWTPMAQAVMSKISSMQGLAESFPMKRFSQASEVAAGAVWLVSDEASVVTGVNLPMDGGQSII
jgi:NAD(P)-dependent dehydrogenase (short-subunit alcohol dehydrogenase family)